MWVVTVYMCVSWPPGWRSASWLQGLRDSLRGVRRGLPGCRGRAGNTPRIYLHLIPKERSGLCSCKISSLVWYKTPAIHLLLRTSVLKEAPREPKNMCVWGGGTVCLCLCIFIIKKGRATCACACRLREDVHFKGNESKTWHIAADSSNYFYDFTLSSWICQRSLRFSSKHVTFYSNLTDVEVMMPSTSGASSYYRPASPKTPTLPEGSDRDDFNSSQPFNDGWTCSCRNIWQAAVSFDKRDWVNEGRMVGRSRYTHRRGRRADRPQMMADGVKGGIVKKKKKKIAVQSVALTIWCQPPRWGDVTGWQVGCCCLCHWLGDQGRHAENPTNPDSRLWSLWLQPRPRWHVNPRWHTHARARTSTRRV